MSLSDRKVRQGLFVFGRGAGALGRARTCEPLRAVALDDISEQKFANAQLKFPPPAWPRADPRIRLARLDDFAKTGAS